MDEGEKVTVYVTKYALTEGVLCKEAKMCRTKIEDEVRMIKITNLEYYHKPDWHLTEEEAIERVKIMQEKKLASIKKQLDKVSTISPVELVRNAKRIVDKTQAV